MRGLVAVILAIMTGMFCSVVTYLPEIGDDYRSTCKQSRFYVYG